MLEPKSKFVVHVIRSCSIGGVERQARDLAAELVLRGRSVSLMVLAPEPLPQPVREWHESCVPVDLIPDRRGCFLGIDRVFRIASVFRSRQEEIVHFHYALPDSIIWSDVVAAKLSGKLVVVTLHHVLRWPEQSPMQALRQKIARSCVDHFVVTTEFARNLLSECVEQSHVTVIPCAVGQETYQLTKAEARRQLGIEPSEIMVFCLCRMESYKGIFELASELQELRLKFPALCGHFAGNGTELTRFKEFCESANGIQIHGPVVESGVFFAAADLFAMPSSSEGFGLVYLEAAQFKLPSIGCMLPTVAEVVIQGETGWLVATSNAGELRHALTEAISDESERVRRGRNAFTYAKKFDLRSITDMLEHLYSVLSEELSLV